MGITVAIKDNGLDRLVVQIRELSLGVGVDVGTIDARDKETAKIARIHELGLGHMPQRSFLRGTIQRNSKRYVRMSRTLLKRVLGGKMPVHQMLNTIASELKSDVQATIMKGIAPRLRPETLRRKQKAGLPRPKVALYATGKLFEAIKSRIAKAKGK